MEFFRIVPVRTSERAIQRHLRPSALPDYCASIAEVEQQGAGRGVLRGIWGEFRLSRDWIRGGVRYALSDCPNQLQWTITTGFPPAPEAVVVHLTIARTEKEPAFVEEIEAFLDDWAAGLRRLPAE